MKKKSLLFCFCFFLSLFFFFEIILIFIIHEKRKINIYNEYIMFKIFLFSFLDLELLFKKVNYLKKKKFSIKIS